MGKIILFVVILSALSFNKAFNFYLYWDDWYQILGSLYYPEILLGYLHMHPVSALEFKLLAPIFKFEPHFWQFTGFLFKAIDSLSMWPLMFALTGSKKIAFYSCLIFAVFITGMESVFWVSANSSAIVIPLISLGFYFWIKSANPHSIKFFIGLFLFALSILGEPGRAFMLIGLAFIWEFLSIYQKFNFKKIISSLSKLSLLLLIIPLTGFITNKFFNITPDVSIMFKQFLRINSSNIDPVGSLKNLLFGWTLITEQFREWLTIIFLFCLCITLILFIIKKQNSYKIVIFLSMWSFLFYLANYLSRAGTTLGSSDTESRYYAISSVGIVGLLAYGFSFIKSKYAGYAFFLFLLFNLYATNTTLKQYSAFRSIQENSKIWDKIDRDVPREELGSVFMFTGADFTMRARLLDWQDTIPFAVLRKITKREDFPIMTNDKELIARLICEKNVSRHSPFGNIIQKEQILLSHVHAWELKGNELENRSDQERDSIKRIAKCLRGKKE